jgi:hypothetical protein
MFNWIKKRSYIRFAIDPRFYSAYEIYKPDYAHKFMPNWFKSLPQHIPIKNNYNVEFDISSVKKCPGIRTNLFNGFIIPMWSDLYIKVMPDKTYFFNSADGKSTCHSHMPAQFKGFYDRHVHIKIISPWRIKTDREIKFYWTEPYYFHTEPRDFVIMPALMEFYYQHTTNVHIFAPVKEEPYTIKLQAGEPLIQLIDTGDNKLSIEYDDPDFATFSQSYRVPGETTFRNFYGKMRKLIKSQNT